MGWASKLEMEVGTEEREPKDTIGEQVVKDKLPSQNNNFGLDLGFCRYSNASATRITGHPVPGTKLTSQNISQITSKAIQFLA